MGPPTENEGCGQGDPQSRNCSVVDVVLGLENRGRCPRGHVNYQLFSICSSSPLFHTVISLVPGLGCQVSEMQGKGGEMLTVSPCLFTQTLHPNCVFRGKRLWRQVLFGGPGAGRASAPGADFVPAPQGGWHPFSLPGGGGSSFARGAGFACRWQALPCVLWGQRSGLLLPGAFTIWAERG